MSDQSKIVVAAIQMCAKLAAVDHNLEMAEKLVETAFAEGANWAILPEFFTSAMAFHPEMLEAARPADGESYRLLVNLARKYGGVVGGSFLAMDQGDVYNRFILAFPDGSTFIHDKDLPTMIENCYYRNGTDDGILKTSVGNVGAVLCWEFTRSQTLKRLNNKVDVIVGGSCAWDIPEGFVGDEAGEIHNYLLNTLRDYPVNFAKTLGVPVVHASHAGDFSAFSPPDAAMPYNSHYLGETKIVDGYGQVLASRTYEEGEGIIYAEIELGQVNNKRSEIPDTFWLYEHPPMIKQSWDEQNKFGQDYYRQHHK
jgi:predicted amidohydrolase